MSQIQTSSRPCRWRLLCRLGLWFLILGAPADRLMAGSPEVQIVLPRGGQRGTELDLTIRGQRLADAQELFFYDPSIQVLKVDASKGNELKCHVKIAPDAPLGEHQLRLRTATGLSELRTFFVSPFPVVESKKPNNDFKTPQPIPLNCTVEGTIENEEVDYFVVDAKKGQRLTAEVHGMRLATTVFDPYIAILDTNRFELAVSDDTALALQDPIASIVAPADGKYIIQIRESSYGGNGDSKYLLHVGTFPRPRAVYPNGGKAGEDLDVTYIGDASGPFAAKLHLPATPAAKFEVFPEQESLLAPSPNFVRVSPFPNVLEAEPNNDPKSATVYKGPLPVAFNGIIEKAGDIDFFRFTAKKGQPIEVRVFARQLRSPLDSVLRVYNADGGQMADNDDSGGPDSYLRFNPPADADYLLSVTDQLGQGGPDYTYRVELTSIEPHLAVTIPQVQQNSQERLAVVVPRGGKFATLMRAAREDFGGEVAISSTDLPAGVTMSCQDIPANTDIVPVLFEASPDAAQTTKLSALTARCTDPKQPITGGFSQNIELIYGNNNTPLHSCPTDKLPIAVVKEVPFKIHLEQPKVPLLQNGQMSLKVTAERSGDFKGPIAVHMLFNPPGVSSSPQVDMPADKNEIAYPLSANEGAEPRKWKICMLAQADVGGVGGQVWLASELVDLEVASSFVNMKLEMAATERGKPAQVYASLEQKTKFDGAAQVKLIGLPPETTAPDQTFTANDKKVVFNVNTTDKSPIGQHTTLFCQITFTQNGMPIEQDAGRGGVLRIDPPPPPKKDEKPVAAAPPPPPKPAVVADKPLSRLEKLRQEQEQKK